MTVATIGKKVKKFKFETTDENVISLEQFKGKKIVLYFYPRDNTPGCTTESKDFSEHYDEFLALNTVILGISRDSLKSHHKFCEKFSFPFPLISDEQETLCEYFEVMKMKNMYGKQVRGIERSTFVIDETGTLEHAWRKVKVPGHVEAVLAYLQAEG